MKKAIYATISAAVVMAVLSGCTGNSLGKLPQNDTESAAEINQSNGTAAASPSYLCPETATKTITAADMEGRRIEDIRLIKNEILARHGYVFSDDTTTRDYFKSQGWYKPNPDFSQDQLQGVELTNFRFLQDYIASKEEEAEGTTAAPAQTNQAANTPPPPVNAQSVSNIQYCLAGNFVTLRSAANINSAAITRIPYNGAVEVLSSANGFHYVNYNGYTGYVLSRYFSPLPNQTPDYSDVVSPSTSTSSSSKTLYCYASDYATLRSYASTSASAITTIPCRGAVTYLGREGEFYYVKYNGYTGYVLTRFFSSDYNHPLNYSNY